MCLQNKPKSFVHPVIKVMLKLNKEGHSFASFP